MVDVVDMKASVPKVSIGMPVYNGEKTICDSLDSLLAQTFQDFEIIISDNASVDGTAGICQKYCARDARIRYIRQPENRGAVANFQFVLDQAKGEYFMWAAADDMWSSNWLETLLIDAKPNVVSFGSWQHVDTEGAPVGKLYYKGIVFPGGKLMRLAGLIFPYPCAYNHLIYGLFHAESLRMCDPLALAGTITKNVTPNGNEIVALFYILQTHSIHVNADATLYYRGGGVSNQGEKSVLQRAYGCVKSPIHAFWGSIALLGSLPKENPEKRLLNVVYPCVAFCSMVFRYGGLICAAPKMMMKLLRT